LKRLEMSLGGICVVGGVFRGVWGTHPLLFPAKLIPERASNVAPAIVIIFIRIWPVALDTSSDVFNIMFLSQKREYTVPVTGLFIPERLMTETPFPLKKGRKVYRNGLAR
jgi:hypothetical protein